MIRVAASVLALLALVPSAYAVNLVNRGQVLRVQVISDVPDNPPVIPPSGGGGGSSSASTQTGVTISGKAYPLSRVSVLRNGSIAATTIAGPDAAFSVTLSRIPSGTHTISVRGEDSGLSSRLFSFPLTVTAGAMTTVSGVFLSPTIDLDKSQVRQGDPLAVFGRTVPLAQVTITVHSEQLIQKKVLAQNDGVYLYYLDTTPLAYGDHTAQSLSGTSTVLSPVSDIIPFKVGTESVLKREPPQRCGKADVNCDGRVDIVDYSILAYWYKRPGALPARVDLNADSAVTLTDLSIMAYYWTG